MFEIRVDPLEANNFDGRSTTLLNSQLRSSLIVFDMFTFDISKQKRKMLNYSGETRWWKVVKEEISTWDDAGKVDDIWASLWYWGIFG